MNQFEATQMLVDIAEAHTALDETLQRLTDAHVRLVEWKADGLSERSRRGLVAALRGTREALYAHEASVRALLVTAAAAVGEQMVADFV